MFFMLCLFHFLYAFLFFYFLFFILFISIPKRDAPRLGGASLSNVTTKIYRTTFLRAFPAVKPGVLRAGMFIGAPVWGFLPVRDFLERTINVPNPVTTTLSPFFRASVTAPKTAATASLAALAVRLAFFATTSTKSALVIFSHLHLDRRLELDIFLWSACWRMRSISMRQCRKFGLSCQDINF